MGSPKNFIKQKNEGKNYQPFFSENDLTQYLLLEHLCIFIDFRQFDGKMVMEAVHSYLKIILM